MIADLLSIFLFGSIVFAVGFAFAIVAMDHGWLSPLRPPSKIRCLFCGKLYPPDPERPEHPAPHECRLKRCGW